LPDFFENRFEDSSRLLRIVASLVIIVFFTVYTSSGLVGGGKLFENAFNQSYELGLYVTAGVVVLYTLFGGFLAVSMTDFVQGCIMFAALILVPVVAVLELGGVAPVVDTISSIDAKHLWISNLSIAAVVSSLAWGLGYFGQPHIIVRFMAIRSIGEIKLARRIGMSWMVTCLLGAMATGFVGIAFIHKAQVPLNDPEAIFIVLSQLLFHPFISGFLLAAVLAAIMSTVSSQLLVTSSSLTEDIYKAFLKKQASQHQLVFVGRICVVLVAMLAIFLAHNRDSSILQLVSHAWAGFGAAFGPMILLSLYWPRMTSAGALAGIVVGAATVLVWIYAPISIAGQSLSQIIYAMVPGFLLSALAIVLVSRLTKAPSAQINAAFVAMQSRVKSEL
jgi:solute:Na+ symporter, SSS family